MGIEFDEIKLTDVYIKSNPNKIMSKYGQQFNISLDSNGKRTIVLNPAFKEPVSKPEEEQEEEKLLDEQKIF